MKKQIGVHGSAPRNQLGLSSDAQHEADKEQVDRTAEYQKKYRPGYWAKNKRITGTLPNKDFFELEARAKASGRRVFWQIWAEAKAYRDGERLKTLQEIEQERKLIFELRKIGNNINQLARRGHLEARKHGGLKAAPGDQIGQEVIRQFTRLETLVARFSDGINISVSLSETSEARDDH